jgi:UDP-glucose 4-epimerase
MGAGQRSRVLVTGGSGFIGRRLAAALLSSGAEVTVAGRHEPAARCGSPTFYGPGMKATDSFVPRLMRAARDGHGIQVYGDSTPVRDLVPVGAGEMPAAFLGIAAARALGYQPAHDLKSGLGTVWQEFTSPAAAEGETAQ